MRDGQAVWGGVCADADAVADRCGEERAETQGEALDLPFCLHSNPHLWLLAGGIKYPAWPGSILRIPEEELDSAAGEKETPC